MQIERRRHIRVPGPFTAAVRVGNRTATARVLNLSEGGCYVEGVSAAPAAGCSVTLAIALPNASTLTVTGEASFRRPDGYAVLFPDLTDQVKRAIAMLRHNAL
ncbi:MAG: PilZ domain-containing protein [Vicinamibacterales bacterium]